MGDVIRLQDQLLIENSELIADLCRFRENLLTEKSIRRKYRLDNATWERLGSEDGDELVEKIEEESARRIRSGAAKREKSQGLITKAPAILDSIMSDVSASPRHRVDAIKTLDSFTGNGPEGAPAADRFVITINLGADHVEHYNKSISISADDVVPNDGSTTPQRSLSVANKPWDADSSDVVATPLVAHETNKKLAKTPVKKRESVVELKSPEQIALETMMNRGWD